MNVNFNILNQLGSPSLNSNTFANRPAAGQTGRLFISTDTREIYRDTGSGWDLVGTGTGGGISGSGAANQVTYWTGTSAVSGESSFTYNPTTNALRVDGNISAQTNASAWTVYNVLQIYQGAFGSAGVSSIMTANTFFDGNWKYINSDYATSYTQNAGEHFFRTSQVSGTAGNNISWIIGMHLNASSNLGVNTSPSSWRTNYQVVELPYGSALYSQSVAQRTGISSNAYQNNSSNWIYSTTNTAQYFEMNAGAFTWNTAASGTIGNTITWTTAMTLNSSGNLGVGVTPSSWLAAYKAIQYGTMGATYTESAASRVGQVSNAFLSSSTGSWTYITGNSVIRNELEAGQFNIYTAGGGTAGTTATMTRRFQLTNGGQLNFTTGTAPNWLSGVKAIQISNRAVLWTIAEGNTTTHFSDNLYYDSSERYISTNPAVDIAIVAGAVLMQTAPSGTINTVATKTTRFRLHNTGNISINSDTDTGNNLYLNGSLRIDGQTAVTAGGSASLHLIVNCGGTNYKIALLNV